MICECGHTADDHKEIEPGYAPCSIRDGEHSCQCDDLSEVVEDDEPIEPEEGDITTEDHIHFYQYGKLWLIVPYKTAIVLKGSQRLVETYDERVDYRKAVKAQMKKDNFFP